MNESGHKRKWRLVVVDDRAFARAAARALLLDSTQIHVIGEAGSGPAGIELIDRIKPDLVLMDVEMPGMGGAETAAVVLDRHPSIRIVAWTISESGDDLVRMLRAGCLGYVLKDIGPQELERALVAAMRDDAPLPRKMVPDLIRKVVQAGPAPTPDLTRREVEVLRMLARGEAIKAMAQSMRISPKTVEGHATRLYRKVGVTNRVEAVSWAIKAGVISLDEL